MSETEKTFVQNLANESDKIDETDNSLMKMANKLTFSEILPWNGELKLVAASVDPSRSNLRTISIHKKLILNRKLKFEPNQLSSDNRFKEKSRLMPRKLISLSKELPVLKQKPVHSSNGRPFSRISQMSTTSEGFYQKLISEAQIKAYDLDFINKIQEQDLIRRCSPNKTVSPLDLIKQQEIVSENCKPVNKIFEISIEELRKTIRHRRFPKSH